MTRGVTFGAVHSFTDLHLILQTVDVQPAQPKINHIDIPGADGSKDLTEALGVGVKYSDRTLSFTFALYPGDSWSAKQSQVSNAINGKALHITLDDDPDWYYDGRVAVESYTADKLLRQITVTATCQPYKLRVTETTKGAELTETVKAVTLQTGVKPVVPTIYTTAETQLTWGDSTVTLAAGTHRVPAFRMSGTQEVTAKVTTGTGLISFTWREGSL